jgi:hypothetical protein
MALGIGLGIGIAIGIRRHKKTIPIPRPNHLDTRHHFHASPGAPSARELLLRKCQTSAQVDPGFNRDLLELSFSVFKRNRMLHKTRERQIPQ